MNGKVYLIGAGPGAPELLTLKAARALARADVVLVDDLVDRRVLEFAPAARVIEVGKRGGCKSTPQAFIERLMVRLARGDFRDGAHARRCGAELGGARARGRALRLSVANGLKLSGAYVCGK